MTTKYIKHDRAYAQSRPHYSRLGEWFDCDWPGSWFNNQRRERSFVFGDKIGTLSWRGGDSYIWKITTKCNVNPLSRK